jgi:hypothetical protein
VSALITRSYKITVEVLCPEGETECDQVRLVGLNKRNGMSITLIGKEIHTTGPDGVTPAHFLGYQFKIGQKTYWVGEDGEFQIAQGSKLLVDECGIWNQ